MSTEQSFAPGVTIDRYQILRKLGEGGFGEVFEAEQLLPVRRKVALKVILQGMNTREVIARFDAERQTLALMDHPNIAKVLDAGATEQGQPFFVMELIDGVPINQFCDEQKLSIAARLRLIKQSCAAIQHAHSKGIVHRDLKPSNILVTQVDGEATVKVIDFGVAKALSGRLTDLSLATKVHQMLGTVHYMSPEQIRGSADIDTRTDVYALGAVLYELLTGETPLQFEESGGALAELQRIVLEVDPIRPSTRIAQSKQSLNSRAESCSTSVSHIKVAIRGELDWIALKALEKAPDQRYDTVSAMAADLQRYLDGQPVSAAPRSSWYRARKLIARNKLAFGAAAAVMLSLAVGVVGFAWQASQASARALELEQVAKFQAAMLKQIDPSVLGNQLTIFAKESLVQTLRARNLGEADLKQKIAEFDALWQGVNATDTARELILEALLEPSELAINREFISQPVVQATLQQSLADRYFELGIFDRARPLAESALKLRLAHLGNRHVETLRTHVSLCNLVGSLGDSEGAKVHCELVLKQMPNASGHTESDLIAALNAASGFAYEQNNNLEAIRLGEQSLALSRRQGSDTVDTIALINSLGAYHMANGQLQKAEPLFREGVERSVRALGGEHSSSLVAYNSLGTLLDSQGKVPEAEEIYTKSLALHRKARGEDNPDTLHAARNLALVLFNRGNIKEAEPLWRFALEQRRLRLGDDHPDTVMSFSDMAALLIAKEEYTEALSFAVQAHDKFKAKFGEAHPAVINNKTKISSCLRKLGRHDEARPYAEAAVALSKTMFDESHPATLMTQTELASVLLAQQLNQQALELLTTLVGTASKTFTGTKAYRSATLFHQLGKAHLRLGHFAEAERNLTHAQKLFVAAPSPARVNLRDCVQLLVELYRRWNEVEPDAKRLLAADRWQAEFNALVKSAEL